MGNTKMKTPVSFGIRITGVFLSKNELLSLHLHDMNSEAAELTVQVDVL